MIKSKSYLVDTNIIIHYTKGSDRHTEFLNSLDNVNVSFIALSELFYGARDKKDLKKLISLAEYFEVAACNVEISKISVEIIKNYSLSHGLTILDSIIAATAIHHKLILATENIKHFKMIKGLKVEKV